MKLLTFLPSLALVATAASQSTSLSFTNQPSDVQIGMPVVIRYTAPAIDQPVQIILRKGERKNLDTVGKPLTSTAVGGSFRWIPSGSLSSSEDYALQIKQGDQSNYSGRFAISGSASASVSASVSSSASASASSSMSASSSVSSAASASASMSASISSAMSSMIASFNATRIPIMTAPSTMNSPVASGTGAIPISRNGTYSGATLQPTQGIMTATVGIGGRPSGAGSSGSEDGTNSATSTGTKFAAAIFAAIACIYAL